MTTTSPEPTIAPRRFGWLRDLFTPSVPAYQSYPSVKPPSNIPPVDDRDADAVAHDLRLQAVAVDDRDEDAARRDRELKLIPSSPNDRGVRAMRRRGPAAPKYPFRFLADVGSSVFIPNISNTVASAAHCYANTRGMKVTTTTRVCSARHIDDDPTPGTLVTVVESPTLAEVLKREKAAASKRRATYRSVGPLNDRRKNPQPTTVLGVYVSRLLKAGDQVVVPIYKLPNDRFTLYREARKLGMTISTDGPKAGQSTLLVTRLT